MSGVIPAFCGINPFIMTKDIKVQIELTPVEIAELFNSLDSDEQAVFFSRLFILSDNQYDFAAQMLSAAVSPLATNGGLKIMQDIGAFIE